MYPCRGIRLKAESAKSCQYATRAYVAARGDIRFDTRNDLTAAELTELNAVLDSHDPGASGDTPDQDKSRQTRADTVELRAIYDAGIADRTMELNTKLTLIGAGEDL